MSILRPQSLRWRLTLRLTIAQVLMLAFILGLNFIGFGALWYFGAIGNGRYDSATTQAVADGIHRDAQGHLYARNTAELLELRAANKDFWFIVRDDGGNLLVEGNPPEAVQKIQAQLDVISYAQFSKSDDGDASPFATIQRAQSPAGSIRVFSAGTGKVQFKHILGSIQPPSVLLGYMTVVLTLTTLLVMPFVIRRAFKGLEAISAETKKIDIERTGQRLSHHGVPLEILPFVNAVNDALARLDKGYEGHKRFLADAAHELRTPIAIITTRLSALPASPIKSRLLEDASRLTALAGQLLDLQRMEQQTIDFGDIDLVSLSERVVFDLAPLAFEAGYEMNFEPDASPVQVKGDQVAIERALTNLVQNAINYGGRQGTISVRVSSGGWIDVCDEGNGIPEQEREHIFDAFYRLNHDGRGAGLGLDLVQKVMQLHGGQVTVAAGPTTGACFRLIFPV